MMTWQTKVACSLVSFLYGATALSAGTVVRQRSPHPPALGKAQQLSSAFSYKSLYAYVPGYDPVTRLIVPCLVRIFQAPMMQPSMRPPLSHPRSTVNAPVSQAGSVPLAANMFDPARHKTCSHVQAVLDGACRKLQQHLLIKSAKKGVQQLEEAPAPDSPSHFSVDYEPSDDDDSSVVGSLDGDSREQQEYQRLLAASGDNVLEC